MEENKQKSLDIIEDNSDSKIDIEKNTKMNEIPSTKEKEKTVIKEAKVVPKNDLLEKCKQIFSELKELSMTVILLLLPFMSVSYMNLINLICGIFMALFFLNVKFYKFFLIKKVMLIIIFIINILDITFRLTMYSLMNFLKNEEWIKILNEYFNFMIDEDYFIFNIFISGLIICALFLYHVFKCCYSNSNDFTDEYIFNIKSLKIVNNIQYFIMFCSYFLIFVCGSMHPNSIFLCKITFIFFILSTWLCGWHSLRKKLQIFFAHFLLYWLMIFIIVQYVFNLNQIKNHFIENNELINIIGIILFNEDKKNDKDDKKGKNIFLNSLSLILLEGVLLLTSVYIKCRDYKLKVKSYKGKDTKDNKDLVREKSLDDKNLARKKLIKNTLDNRESFISNGIILVSSPSGVNENIAVKIEEEKTGFFSKLRNIIFNYIYTPYFIMHLCRIGAIIWLTFVRQYTSTVLIIWVFRSFVIKSSKDIYFFTAYIVFPILIITNYLTYLVNIEGIVLINDDENIIFKELGLTKFSSDEEVFFTLSARFLLTYLFGIYIYIHLKTEKENFFNNVQLNSIEEVKKSSLESSSSINNVSNVSDSSKKVIKENNLREPLIDNVDKNPTKGKNSNYLLNFNEVMIKILFSNFNFITIFFMYLSTFHEVNLIHLLMMIIFIIQIICLYAVKKYSKIFMIIIQFIVFIEYIWNFIQNKIRINSERSKTILEFIGFIIDGNNQKKDIPNCEIYLWIVLYCLYIEYQNYSSKFSKEYHHKQISLNKYFETKFASKPNLIKFLKIILDFLKEIYLWGLIFGYLATIVFYTPSIIQGVKLVGFFLAISKYLKAIECNYENSSGSLKYIKTLTSISIISSFFLYIYQFEKFNELDLVKYLTNFFPDILKVNAIKIGFESLSEDFIYKFIPNISSSFLSILIYKEVYRIIISKKIYKKDNEEDNISVSNIIIYFYEFIFFILNYYWVGVFLLIFSLSVQWKLSYSMLILLTIFAFTLLKSFIEYLKNFQINREKIKLLTNFNSILRAYSEEKADHFKIGQYYRTKTFNLVWIINIIFIVATYFISISIDFKINLDENIKKYLKAYSYILGLYFSDTDSIKDTFFEATYGYNLLLIFLILEKYFQNKCKEFYGRLKNVKNVDPFNKKNIVKIKITEASIDVSNEKYIKGENTIRESNFNFQDGDSNMKELPRNDFNFIKKARDPLSASAPNNFQQKPKRNFKEDLKNYLSEPNFRDKNIIKENEDNTPRTTNLPQMSSDYFDNEKIDIQINVNHFKFFNIFERKRAQSERHSFNIGIGDINKILNIGGEKVLIIDSESESEEEAHDENVPVTITNVVGKIEKVDLDKNQGNDENKLVDNSQEIIFNNDENNYSEYEKEIVTRQRRRKNASYQKQSLMKYSLEFQTGIKKVLEELILFLILLSAFLKVNVLSFINIFIVIITYSFGNKLKSIFYLSSINIFLFIIQYSLFTSNISNYTDHSSNIKIIHDSTETLDLPWYTRTVGKRLGMFFSLGVTKYQINTLWIDFIILIFNYFYLEFFSFAIYEAAVNSNKIAFSENKNSFKILSSLSPEQYENFKYSMKLSFDIEIQKLNQFEMTRRSNDNQPYYKDLMNRIKNKTTSQDDKKVKNKLLSLYKAFKRYTYLSFHNITLIIILIFSMMNNGLISIPYILFSTIYIYKTHNFLTGNKWTFLHSIKYFLKPLLFIDLIGQLIYQIPLDAFLIHDKSVKYAMKILGFELYIDYSSPTSMLVVQSFTLSLLKIITYLLVSLQEIIYSSNDFKMYILKYYLKIKETFHLKSKLHAYVFNNSRIILMDERIQERKNIDETLKKIELQLYKWNEKLLNAQNFTQLVNSMNKTPITKKRLTRKRNISIYKKDFSAKFNPIINDNLNKLKKIDEISIRRILLKDWLIRFSLYLNQQSSFLIGNKIEQEKNIDRILKGHLNAVSKLENLIDKFENENEDKYEILNKIRVKNKMNSSFIQHSIRKKSYKSNISECLKEIKEEDRESYPTVPTNQNDKESYDSQNSNNSNENESSRERNKTIIYEDTEFNDNAYINDTKNEEREDFLNSTDYRELADCIRLEFFKKYCTRGKIIQFIVIDMIKYLAENFEYTCYFFMIINHLNYCSLISVVWPLVVFLEGLIRYPRPRKSFWNFSISYSGIIICFKFLLQIKILDLFFNLDSMKDDKSSIYKVIDYPRIGLKFYQTTLSREFLYYIIWDVILLSILLAHQFMLIRKGLWKDIEIDIETIEEAHDRINFCNSKIFNDDSDRKKTYLNNKISIFKTKHINKIKKLSIMQTIKRHFTELFPTLRNEKPGKDFYIFYTLFQMLIILYIILFYTAMDKDSTSKDESGIQINKFSNFTVYISLFHLLLIVLDRYIYLKSSRKINKLSYKIYDNTNGRQYKYNDSSHNTSFEDIKDLKVYEENEKFDIVYLLYESEKHGLIYKYILQIFLVLIIHLFIFWYLPMTGNFNLHNSFVCEFGLNQDKCNEFSNNMWIKIFYFFYCIYFFFSALQIRYNMVDLKKQSNLMRGDNIFYYFAFITFKAIPFLSEIKSLIDWTFTTTSLDLFKWLKFEGIYDLIFITKCQMKSYYGRKLGTRITNCQKFFSGGLLFFLLLLVIYLPIFLFSNLSPNNQTCEVDAGTLELEIAFKSHNLFSNFTLSKITHLKSKNRISEEEWKKYKFNETLETKNFEREQVQTVVFYPGPDNNWDISEVALNYVKGFLNTNNNTTDFNIFLNLKTSFTRPNDNKIIEPFTSSFEIKSDIIQSSLKNALDLIDNKNRNSESPQIIKIEKFYNPGLLISNSKISLIDKDSIELEKIHLGFNYKQNSEMYWNISSTYSMEKGIIFFVFSEKINLTSSSYSLLYFYAVFIFAIGNVVRQFNSGHAEKVIYNEMPKPNKLFNLCEGIKIARYYNDLEREDRLYYILIDVLRSPDILKMITKSSLYFTNLGFLSEKRPNKLGPSDQNIDKDQSFSKKSTKKIFY